MNSRVCNKAGECVRTSCGHKQVHEENGQCGYQCTERSGGVAGAVCVEVVDGKPVHEVLEAQWRRMNELESKLNKNAMVCIDENSRITKNIESTLGLLSDTNCRVSALEQHMEKVNARLCGVSNENMERVFGKAESKYLQLSPEVKKSRRVFDFIKCEVKCGDPEAVLWRTGYLLIAYIPENNAPYQVICAVSGAWSWAYCRILPFTKENPPPEGCPMEAVNGFLDNYRISQGYNPDFWKVTGFRGAWFE